jgi:hypothetical protein
MRLPEFVRKCVVFIAKPVKQSDGSESVSFLGTGFIISAPVTSVPDGMFLYVVTAQHVANEIGTDEFFLRINNTAGGATLFRGSVDRWYVHPDDMKVDVAVMRITLPLTDCDIAHVDVSMFLDDGKINERRIRPGDEVSIIGLFAPAIGRSKNWPIVRTGQIAMMPDEPVMTKRGLMDAYLVEARSIGGLSGSPVFVRESVVYNFGAGAKYTSDVPGPATGEFVGVGHFWLLGLMHGHWDIQPGDITGAADPEERKSVNMGIAIVVPAKKIMETINQRELVDERAAVEKAELSEQNRGQHDGD